MLTTRHLAAAGALAALSLLTAAVPASAAESLYVVPTAGGTLSGSKLVLTGIGPRVATFTDRPAREGGSVTVKSLVSGWDRTFGEDPPNAALEVADAPKSRDVALLELRSPRYDARARTLTYAVKRIGKADGGLTSFGKRADRGGITRFGVASLFIDPGAAATTLFEAQVVLPVNTQIQITLTNTTFDHDTLGVTGQSVSTPSTQNSSGLPINSIGGFVFLPTSMKLSTSTPGQGFQASILTGIIPPAGGANITGRASVPSGAQLFIAVSNPSNEKPIPNGPFSIPVP